MKFKTFSEYLRNLEKTSSRIEITKILAELFKITSIEEIDKVTYLSLGTLAPSYKGIVFNLAERMMVRILAKAYGKKVENVTKLYKKEGDLGTVAEELSKSKSEGKRENVTVIEVYEKLLLQLHSPSYPHFYSYLILLQPFPNLLLSCKAW